MKGGSNLTWKSAALPLAALTAALAVGMNYFVGGERADDAAPAGNSPSFKFDQGPQYAPGSPAAAGFSQGRTSSIEMFREVNKGYASETPDKVADIKPLRKPRGKEELREFLSQVRHDINYDPAAETAAPTGGAAGELPGRTAAAGGRKGAPAAGTAGTRAGATANDRAGALNSGRGGFAAGRAGGSVKIPRLTARGAVGAYSQASSGGSRGQTGGPAASGGGGRDLEAAAYGTHGGGSASSRNSSSGEESSGPAGGAAQEEAQLREPPGPAAMIWPRSFDFGEMYMYETAARLVIVMNVGDAPLHLGAIENLDPETPFKVEQNHCSKAAVAPGKSCTFKVRFSPVAQKEYITGFGISSDDQGAMDYQSYIEVRGVSKYSYATWWWRRFNYSAALNNRLAFGMVPAGFTTDEILRVTNNSGEEWEDLKLDVSKLPSVFRITGDSCSGGNLAPNQSCRVTVTFAPTDAVNRKFSSSAYGQYHAENLYTGAKLYHPRPAFPPLVLEKPVEADPKGEIRVLTDYNNRLRSRRAVLGIPVQGKSCAEFPVKGLARLQHYYFFR